MDKKNQKDLLEVVKQNQETVKKEHEDFVKQLKELQASEEKLAQEKLKLTQAINMKVGEYQAYNKMLDAAK